MRYRDRSVLITGAAGGLGRLAATRFAAEGARLALCDLDGARLDDNAAELRATGAEVLAETVDVSTTAEIEAFVARIVAEFGGLHAAINSAGIGQGTTVPLADLPEDAFERAMAVNARGVFLCMKYEIPVMVAGGGGAIVNVASAAGLVGSPRLAAYSASKHAVIGLTRSAAAEYARSGVRINALCPAFTETPLLDRMVEHMSGTPDEARTRLTAGVPMRRTGRPEEIVPALLWLCAEENSFVTGQAIAVDGGLTAV